MPITPLPLPGKLEVLSTENVTLDIAYWQGGEVIDRKSRLPSQDNRVLSVRYPLLTLSDSRYVENILQNSRGVDRFSHTYAGTTRCYRLLSGYKVEYTTLGVTISLELSQCTCPHIEKTLSPPIAWDDGITYWDNATWDA